MKEVIRTVCDRCFNEVDAPVETVHETLCVRNVAIADDYEYPVCPKCGNRIGQAAIMDRNLKKAYRRYREMMDIPQPEELLALRRKYGLSQKAFSAALGMGVASVQRYERGSLPTNAHAHLLRSARDVHFMIERMKQDPKGLNEGERLKALETLESCCGSRTDYAFVRLRVFDGFTGAACEDSGRRSFDANRMREAVVYLAAHIRDLYRTKLNKVLFYLDFASYRDKGEGFTGLQYAKADFGPVPHQYELILAALTDGDALALVEQGDGQIVASLRGADLSRFSLDEVKQLEAVAEFANEFPSSAALSEFSHNEKGWLETGRGEIIPYRYAEFLRWQSR